MSMTILAVDCGCVVEVAYDYLSITQDIIDAYALARDPQNERVYKAFDAAFRALLGATAVTYFDRFTITGTGTFDANGDEIPDITYSRADLKDSTILGVSIEGQGVNESDPATVNIDTTTDTDNVVFSRAAVGQQVKIDYKKTPTL